MSVKFKFNSESVEKYRDLADQIKDNLVLEGNNIKEKEPHSAYYSNLPRSITKEQVEELEKYNAQFITAAHVAVGELAANFFIENKGEEEVTSEIGFFGKNDTIKTTVHKEKTYTNHFADSNSPKEITKCLVMETTININSNKGKGLKAIRESMSKEFADMFKK